MSQVFAIIEPFIKTSDKGGFELHLKPYDETSRPVQAKICKTYLYFVRDDGGQTERVCPN